MSELTPLSVHEPVGAPRGGVVVVQHAFGVNDHIEDVCRRFADQGWLAIAPHLFHRSGDPRLDYSELSLAVPHVRTLTSDGVLADVDAALEHLAGAGIPSDRVGVVGLCLGGTIALVVAARRDLGLGITLYGGGIEEGRWGFGPLVEEATRLRAPWLGLFGDLDESIPVAHVEALRAVVASSEQPTEIVRYPEAGHAFLCEGRDTYHAASAVDAWSRMFDWFDRHLVV